MSRNKLHGNTHHEKALIYESGGIIGRVDSAVRQRCMGGNGSRPQERVGPPLLPLYLKDDGYSTQQPKINPGLNIFGRFFSPFHTPASIPVAIRVQLIQLRDTDFTTCSVGGAPGTSHAPQLRQAVVTPKQATGPVRPRTPQPKGSQSAENARASV